MFKECKCAFKLVGGKVLHGQILSCSGANRSPTPCRRSTRAHKTEKAALRA
jgi:hypothetical protein